MTEADNAPREAGQRLIPEANENGGHDNITVVLFRLEEVAGAPADGDDRPTQVGRQGPTAEQIEEASADRRPAPAHPAVARAGRPSRATAPRRAGACGGLGSALVLLAILAVLGAGAAQWPAARRTSWASTTRGS